MKFNIHKSIEFLEILTAYYYPPGNIAGEFHENVFPPVEQMMRPESANSNNANN